MIELRLAQAEHLSKIAEIERLSLAEAWSEQALELFVKDGAYAVICLVDGEPVSYCTVIDAPFDTQIVNVSTHPEHRGKGYARQVVGRVLEEAQKRGAEIASLEVRESNASAIGLYKALGFEVEGRRKDFYASPREDACIMIKKI